MAGSSSFTALPSCSPPCLCRQPRGQDRASGNATVVTVAKAASENTSTMRFSAINVMDDALTVGQNMNTSKIIGRAQGIYVSDSIETSSVMMAMNFLRHLHPH
nr:unnamed protein product [Digitaria exilis]